MNPRDLKLMAVRRAAIAEFSRNGFAATSMADLAVAAGVSRPALYQWFRNREDVFRSALALLLHEAVDAALAQLDSDTTLPRRLDAFLQRFFGDLTAAMASSPHGDEITDAKLAFASDVSAEVHERLHKGIERFLRTQTDDRRLAAQVADLLTLAPTGLKHALPSVAAYRRRLTTLADAAAALLAARRP